MVNESLLTMLGRIKEQGSRQGNVRSHRSTKESSFASTSWNPTHPDRKKASSQPARPRNVLFYGYKSRPLPTASDPARAPQNNTAAPNNMAAPAPVSAAAAAPHNPRLWGGHTKNFTLTIVADAFGLTPIQISNYIATPAFQLCFAQVATWRTGSNYAQAPSLTSLTEGGRRRPDQNSTRVSV